ncbi:hypothetical protein BDZ90DRAFT_100274 [Jaminaea rosea]|uniref:Uncharacterized protein n=1 Tax=Jaminaea rosea TaxID=1569628 RepID=A0A316UH40_9BASI|nr:hypothetical protein BDZ90DRAFT_100274 [Jaminaea rosea]PWN24569.1 hypothetical protein BDZ90DRAFT_100274 [Jaminaea rosea]
MLERMADANAVRHFVLTEEAGPGEGEEHDEDDAAGRAAERERQHAILWFFQPRLGLSMDLQREECEEVARRLIVRPPGQEGYSKPFGGAEELVMEACKILYRPLNSSAPDTTSSSSFSSPNHFETLVLPHSLCLRLMAFLEVSTQVFLPEERRSFGAGAGQWRVGWLPRSGGAEGGRGR